MFITCDDKLLGCTGVQHVG